MSQQWIGVKEGEHQGVVVAMTTGDTALVVPGIVVVVVMVDVCWAAPIT